MQLKGFLALSTLSILILLTVSCGGGSSSNLVALPNDIVIGTMLSPGEGASASQLSYQTAAKVAADDANAEFEAAGSPYRVKLVQGDLGANPDIALDNLKKLFNEGVRLVVGPAESVNLTSLTSFAQSNGMILISNASTAPTLAQTDNVFRVVPNDILQTRLLAKKVKADGFSNMVIVSRNDLYGRDFRDNLKIAFEDAQIGGTVVGELVYDPNATVFTQQIELLHDAILASNSPINPSTTALVMVSFEEIVLITKEMIAKDKTRFGAFRWYAGDGVAQINDVVDDPIVAQFLLDANLIATSPAVLDVDKPKLVDFYARLQAESPGTPNSMYAALTHDAVTLLAKTMADIKAQKKSEDVGTIKQTLISTAANYNGITGNLAFNAEGDRASLPYGIFGLSASSSTPKSYAWVFNGLLTE